MIHKNTVYKAQSCGFPLFFLIIGAFTAPFVLTATESPVQPLSYDEAYAIVRAEEEAKERELDERYERYLNRPSKPIISTYIDEDGKEVTFVDYTHDGLENYLKYKAEQKAAAEAKSEPAPLDPEIIARLKAQAGKPMVNISLSGQVDNNGISELWWTDQGVRHRAFTNANFFYFTGFANFENEHKRYHTFLVITPRHSNSGTEGASVPAPADFPAGSYGYIPVEPADPQAADYTILEDMLAHYTEHVADMKTTYENRQLLARARKDYLEAHPPKKRNYKSRTGHVFYRKAP